MSDDIEKLEHLVALKEKGLLTEEEFQIEKQKILSGDKTDISIGTKDEPLKQKQSNKGPWIIGIIIIALVGIVYFSINSSGSSGNGVFNSHEGVPSYIKKVAAYKEGSDGIVVYFILANQNGEMISSSGSFTIDVYETDYSYPNKSENLIFHSSGNVNGSDFQDTKVGQGAFEHSAILCSIGRIPYSSFIDNPTDKNGKVKIEFTSNGKTISGEDDIFF